MFLSLYLAKEIRFRKAMLLYSKTLVKSMYYCFAMVTLFLMSLILFGFIELPISSYALEPTKTYGDYDESASFLEEPFTELSSAYRKWDVRVGCENYRQKVMRFLPTNNNSTSLQDPDGIPCNALKMKHVSILVEGWTWIPDGLDNLYSCRCGLSCLWTKSKILADQPEARLFETTTPPSMVIFFDRMNFYLIALVVSWLCDEVILCESKLITPPLGMIYTESEQVI